MVDTRVDTPSHLFYRIWQQRYPLSGLGILFALSLFTTGESLLRLGVAGVIVIVWLFSHLLAAYRRPLVIDPLLASTTLIFCLWLILSIFWSVSFSTTFVNSFWLSTLGAGFMVITLYRPSAQQWRDHLSLVIAITVISSLYACYQFIWLEAEPRSVFLNQNNHAALTNIALLFLLSIALLQRPWRLTPIIATTITILLFTMFISQSRGAMLSLAISAVALTFLLWRRVPLRAAIQLLLLTLFAYLLSELAAGGEIATTVKSFGNSFNEGKVRFDIWHDALQLWHQFPLLGSGFGSFWLTFPSVRNPETTDYFFYAHNDYLQLLLEVGTIGLLLLFLLYAVIAHRYLLLFRVRDSHPNQYIEGSLMIVTLGCIAIHSFFTFNFYLMSILLLLGMALARFQQLLLQCQQTPTTLRLATLFPRRPAFVAITVAVALLLGHYPLALGVSDLTKSRGIRAIQQGDLKQGYRDFSLASRISPGVDVFHLLQGNFGLDILRRKRSEEFVQRTTNSYRSCLEVNRYRVECALGMAQLFRKFVPEIEMSDEIEALYRDALSKNRGHPLVLAHFAQLLIEQRRIKEAYALLNGTENYQMHGKGYPLYLQTYISLLETMGVPREEIIRKLKLKIAKS
ncbi:MAG: O-antigen ligase family protein [Gammaproteobacteria bacterium]|nr:O-antigen ligase family protein [Gammaproteobacteria bacterium]